MSITHLDGHRPDAGGFEGATPDELITRVRQSRAAADAAEVDLLRLALAWAHAHLAAPDDESWHAPAASGCDDGSPTDTDDVETLEWFGIPEVAWDAPAAFAAANHMSTTAGKAFLRDALILAHRLPRIYARLVAGQVPVWRARRIAHAVIGKPADVAAYVDTELAKIAHQVGVTTLDRTLDEAMTYLYPEQREAEQLEALDQRYARLDERSLNHTGIGEMTLRADWADLKDFDRALSLVAAALKRDGCTESLDVRRAMAVGILADPARALALINNTDTPAPTKGVVAYVHLSEDAVRGLDPLARDEHGRTWLEQTIRDWCGRNDRFVSVRPVIDLNQPHPGTSSYAPPDSLRERIILRNPTCVFPHCARPSRDCDLDHLVPWAEGGQTTEDNLAPVCRHHHRLKTHTAWRYQCLVPGVYLWHDPHGQRFLTTPTGTTDLT
ncbi:MAG: HNH endonuclease signature motif containing protein [Nocardioides sp.]|nr:HNH endonuclease signature motif containing protein [Nocardioides sp.]